MKIDDLIQEELKDPEFTAAYRGRALGYSNGTLSCQRINGVTAG